MSKFITRLIKFLAISCIGILILSIITSITTNYIFDYTIENSKNILILGNSHPECALNDSIITNAKNLAQSGASYFYDYVKLKTVIEKNPQIDTLIIGYAYDDLMKEMDTWTTSKEKINTQIKYYFFLLDFEDYWNLFKANPIATLTSTPQTIFHNIQMITKGYKFLGGYKALKDDKLKEATNRMTPLEQNKEHHSSKYQTLYLQKIYDFCEMNNIEMILLATPVHPKLYKNNIPLKKGYEEFKEKKLPNATLIDHSAFKIPDSGFRDLSHLHYSGAIRYSLEIKNVLKNNGK
ncbi:hypothetical protein [Cytophaga sp. FL35]|uniref:hypothetical protein n=1 Tax=Cytophaga sp. FL35 TaxID=1904456 RepID=UPI00165349DA|nr:hypothetical protein [Cytophaga sp. FL35]MBC6997992.1 hypothetical protein [Cytophaga sp. FL35]